MPYCAHPCSSAFSSRRKRATTGKAFLDLDDLVSAATGRNNKG